MSFHTVVPNVEVTPRTVTLMQGSSVEAECSASGSPPPEILWNLDMLSTHNEVSRTRSLPVKTFATGPPLKAPVWFFLVFSGSGRHLGKFDACGRKYYL